MVCSHPMYASAYSFSHSSTPGAFQLGDVWPQLYSPDLAPRNYQLFTYLKDWLGSQRFNSNEEFMEGVKTG
jgi:hypothetical protein